jgi:Type IV secretion-system coupling protein DNA-binding domain
MTVRADSATPAPRGMEFSVEVLEGWALGPCPRVAGAEYDPQRSIKAVVAGHDGAIRFDDELLSRHTLFIGAIGSGKTNAMMQLVTALRASASEADVFVIFDTKGDFRDNLLQPEDSVLSNERPQGKAGVVWNLTRDLTHGDDTLRGEEIFEIATTVFAEGIESAGDNMYFAVGARDVFAAVVEALLLLPGADTVSNREIRAQLESSQLDLWELLEKFPHLKGAQRYVSGDGQGPRAILAFLQQQVRAAFSGVFGTAGDFSVRDFVRQKGGRALFVEFDIASGSLLLPIYRVLLDLAIKEALGRNRSTGNVFFVMDEFALLPQLTHLANGINFGRSLGLKFVVGAQNTSQVASAYGEKVATSLLSGFGTVFAFRLMDGDSRDYFSERFGVNRKRLALPPAVASETIKLELTMGSVVEDWDMSALGLGQCLVSLPTGPPFRFAFKPL